MENNTPHSTNIRTRDMRLGEKPPPEPKPRRKSGAQVQAAILRRLAMPGETLMTSGSRHWTWGNGEDVSAAHCKTLAMRGKIAPVGDALFPDLPPAAAPRSARTQTWRLP